MCVYSIYMLQLARMCSHITYPMWKGKQIGICRFSNKISFISTNSLVLFSFLFWESLSCLHLFLRCFYSRNFASHLHIFFNIISSCKIFFLSSFVFLQYFPTGSLDWDKKKYQGNCNGNRNSTRTLP